MDVTGKLVYSNLFVLKGSTNLELDLSNLETGSYFLQINEGEKVVTYKVWKE
jgi:hypothetical protein